MDLSAIGFLALIIIAIPAFGIADDWSPPDNPDPQTILNEAAEDAREKRYETALAKHLWFHENALKFNRGMGGVRLSFALSYWEQLGLKYPPALEKLKAIRDALEKRVQDGEDIGSGFHDLAAINSTLNENLRTADAFRTLDAKNPKAATGAYHFVKSALVDAKAYELYAKYMNPRRDFLLLKRVYELNQAMAKDGQFGADLIEHSRKSFRNQSSTFVAILVVTDRKAEAIEIAALAKKELADPEFHKELEAALSGVVPKPWP